jgi:hypothetical protein
MPNASEAERADARRALDGYLGVILRIARRVAEERELEADSHESASRGRIPASPDPP